MSTDANEVTAERAQMLALHATHVQGGASTPEREAERAREQLAQSPGSIDWEKMQAEVDEKMMGGQSILGEWLDEAADFPASLPTVKSIAEQEGDIEERFYAAMMDASHGSVRSQQAQQFKVGVSDLGFCPERTRRMLDSQTPERTDVLAAFIGTAIGDHAEQAWCSANPDTLRQIEVKVPLYLEVDGERIRAELTGHPDLVIPDERPPLMLDVKTDYGLADSERVGASLSQRFQRHMYGYGCWLSGLFDDEDGEYRANLDEVRVGNVWIDRSAQDKRVHCEIEQFDMEVIHQAEDWLSDVVYHQVHGEEAQKKPPRDMCAVVCGFFGPCRGGDTDVAGLIEDPETLERIAMYRQGLDLEKEGRRLKDQAKDHLIGVSGSTGEWLVRWTSVGESFVPEHTRSGYDKLEVRPLPKGRKR